MQKCFFCDIQLQDDDKLIASNQYFFARYDDFPLSNGHCEIIPKEHIVSFFDLPPEYIQFLYELITNVKEIIDNKFKPDGYNIGINDGLAVGRTQHHLHIHLIPRYTGDVENPRGGIRNIIQNKADYIPEMSKMESKKDYL
jgi:diadenosine tetraphosphate (Ap4A) HIT family hydrolase